MFSEYERKGTSSSILCNWFFARDSPTQTNLKCRKMCNIDYKQRSEQKHIEATGYLNMNFPFFPLFLLMVSWAYG